MSYLTIDQNPLLLTFEDKELETSFKRFYEIETRKYTRVGIILSTISWIGNITLLYFAVPLQFIRLSLVLSICTFPLFAFVIYATFKDHFIGYYQWMAAVANGIAGMLMIYWIPYLVEEKYAVYGILIGLLAVLFFGYYILRLRLIPSTIVSIFYMSVYQIYLILLSTNETVTIISLSYATWTMVCFACIGGYINESTNRKLFLQQKIIHEQQEKIEKAYSLLSKYVAPQLVDTISDGKIDQIWKHNRKKLTLFFSDIKDFTSITDTLEPEDMANVLNEYLSEMNTIINKYKGTLAQVIGDGLYIIFGAPESTNDKDHALRCVKMAVDMQRKMNDLNKNWFKQGIDEVLQIRCGINSGMATVGGYGSSERKEYTAMGMQTNIAARLEQTCTPGGILISHTTWALVSDEIPCSEHGKIHVKGLNRPIRAYRVDALSDQT